MISYFNNYLFLKYRITNRCARNTEWGDLLPVKLSPRPDNAATDGDDVEPLQIEENIDELEPDTKPV